MLPQGLHVLEFCIDARGDCLLLCERRENLSKIANYSSIDCDDSCCLLRVTEEIRLPVF